MKASMSLGEIAEKVPASTTVLRKYHLDFCCGGKKTLEEACTQQNLNMPEILAELNALEQSTSAGDWSNASIDTLIDHLVHQYHDKHRMMLPELQFLADKVERVHAGKEETPVGLAAFLQEMMEDLGEHMNKEEMVLFPMLKAGAGRNASTPIMVMTQEHDMHGENLAKLRKIAFDFKPPLEACGTWRALYNGLDQLEHDLMEHIHIENNILFPKALR